MRAMVIGNEPAAMQEFAIDIGQLYDAPLYDLNTLSADLETDEFARTIEYRLADDNWVIVDGTYENRPGNRIAAADVLYVLQVNPAQAVIRGLKRCVGDHLSGIAVARQRAGRLRLARRIGEQFVEVPDQLDLAMANARESQVPCVVFSSTNEAGLFLTRQRSLVGSALVHQPFRYLT